MKTDEQYMEILRQRAGLPSSDTSEDESIQNLSPREKLCEWTAWYLGSGDWANDILTAAIDLGVVEEI